MEVPKVELRFEDHVKPWFELGFSSSRSRTFKTLKLPASLFRVSAVHHTVRWNSA